MSSWNGDFFVIAPSRAQEMQMYGVFHVIELQEQGCCELFLGLIVSLKASMWPQDWDWKFPLGQKYSQIG